MIFLTFGTSLHKQKHPTTHPLTCLRGLFTVSKMEKSLETDLIETIQSFMNLKMNYSNCRSLQLNVPIEI